jgi:aminoglycoside phosphotransferase (APT) family kinase protein
VDTETSAIVMRHFARGLTATTFDDQALWIHGDIHPGNLVYDGQDLVGLIDFSDLACGDPAVDLGGALLALPSVAHATFWASYGDQDEDLRARSLGWAALLTVLHLQIEIAEHSVLAREALAWLASAD